MACPGKCFPKELILQPSEFEKSLMFKRDFDFLKMFTAVVGNPSMNLSAARPDGGVGQRAMSQPWPIAHARTRPTALSHHRIAVCNYSQSTCDGETALGDGANRGLSASLRNGVNRGRLLCCYRAVI
jgi:hypothetical protein